MRIDVLFGSASVAPSDVSGRVVAVIDVLRASTSIATALANGARAVIPLESSDEVITRAKAFERRDVKLAGERRMLPISGFDFGNSPLEFTSENVEGKTVLVAVADERPYDVVRDAIADLGLALTRLEQRRHRLEDLFRVSGEPAEDAHDAA